MKSIVATLTLLAGAAGAAPAQVLPQQLSSKVHLSAMAGMFAPILPVVAIANGVNASVELESSSAVAVEFSYGLTTGASPIAAYLGLTHIRSRMNHSSALVLNGPSRASSPVNLFTPSLGFLIQHQFGNLRIQPRLRLGVGVKFYEFNIAEVPDGVQDFTGDVGIGVVAGDGPVSFTAEARWMPSSFDPAFLPVSVIGTEKQFQNDWAFLLGLRFGL